MPEGVTTARLPTQATERMTRVGEELGLRSAGLTVVTLQAGQRNRVHRHAEQEEAYLVLSGRLLLVLDDGTLELGRDDLVRVAPETRRQLTNPFDEPVVVLALGARGTHERGDTTAYSGWDEPADAGRPPAEQPLPPDLG